MWKPTYNGVVPISVARAVWIAMAPRVCRSKRTDAITPPVYPTPWSSNKTHHNMGFDHVDLIELSQSFVTGAHAYTRYTCNHTCTNGCQSYVVYFSGRVVPRKPLQFWLLRNPPDRPLVAQCRRTRETMSGLTREGLLALITT